MKLGKEERSQLTKIVQQELLGLRLCDYAETTPARKQRELIHNILRHVAFWGRIRAWRKPEPVQRAKAAGTAE